MSTNKKLFLLDWGIGGLSVYGEVRKRFPRVGCVYVSDSGFTPYGKVGAEELAARVASLMERFGALYPLTEAVIACNAASTVRSEVQKRIPGLAVKGMIEAGVELVQGSARKKIGVIGGIRTVESRVFSSALVPLGFEVMERAAQPLSALIEAGELRGPRMESTLREILGPLEGVEALLLACTHYPAVAEEIQRILPQALLLNPAQSVARGLNAPPEGDTFFFTSGSTAQSRDSARLAFGVDASFTEF